MTATHAPHSQTQHSSQCNHDTCETYLDHFNEQVIPGHRLAWSWYYDMVEDLNACAVAGGEWGYCWRKEF
jgi:hypothetical protein